MIGYAGLPTRFMNSFFYFLNKHVGRRRRIHAYLVLTNVKKFLLKISMQHFTNMLVYLYEGNRISTPLKYSHEEQPLQ